MHFYNDMLSKNIFMYNSNIKNINYYLHPYYGYIDNTKKYIWSFQFYLINPFLFNCIKTKYRDIFNHTFDIKKCKPISYIILLEYDTSTCSCILNNIEKIKNDISIILNTYNQSINIYLLIQNFQNLYNYDETIIYYSQLNNYQNCHIYIDFNLVDVLQTNTSFVVSNMHNSLFLLCFHFALPVIVLSDTKDCSQHLSTFHSNLKLDNLNDVYSNILMFKKYILPHFELTNISENKKFIQHPLLRNVFKQQNIYNLNNSKQILSNIYLHNNFNDQYYYLHSVIQKYTSYTHVYNTDEANVLILSVDESNLHKSVNKGVENKTIVTLDYNTNISTSNDKNFYRYELIKNKEFTFIKSNYELDNLIFHNLINYNNSAPVILILDNAYNHYANITKWIETWKHIVSFIESTIDITNIKIKIHPNNSESDTVINLLKTTFPIKYLIDSNITLDVLLQSPIRFCFQLNGSSYVKCIQYGVLIFSTKLFCDHEKCLFSLNDINNIDSIIDSYQKIRYSVLKKYVNKCLISSDDISNGVFFNKLQQLTC